MQKLETFYGHSLLPSRPLLLLLMHEFCEYLNHQSPELTLDYTFSWFMSEIKDQINNIYTTVEQNKQRNALHIKENDEIEEKIQALDLI